MSKERHLPSLKDMALNPLEAYRNDEFKLWLNQEPPQQWIKSHPFAKGVNYIPIDKIEMMLDRVFQKWRVEVIDYKQLFNAITVQVRLHYFDIVSGEWLSQDGVGAVGIQTDRGAKASDMGAIKNDAVMKALPAAKSFAIKDAAEHIGKVFGRDINRKDVIAFRMSHENPETDGIPENIIKALNEAATLDEIDMIADMEPELKENHPGFVKLLTKHSNRVKRTQV